MNLPDAFSLSIAGLEVKLHFLQPELGARVARRYQAFAGSGNAPHLTCQVDWQTGPNSIIAPDPEMHFFSGGMSFGLLGFEGRIDLQQQSGSLQLCTDNPLEALEYYLRMVYALLVFEAGGLLFHGAGIARAGQGYVFFGYSGSGKTTVCRLSSQHVILNDDLVVLLPVADGRWWVYGTPFWNPTQVRPAAESAPLKMLLRLVQAPQVFTRPTRLAQAAAEIVASAPVISASGLHSSALLGRAFEIARVSKVQFLHFLPDDSFWSVLTEQDERPATPA